MHLRTNTDITRYVISVDKFLDSDVFYKKNSAQIMLSTKTGRFITQSYSGATPLIKPFDEFKLTWTKSTQNYSRIVFFDTRLPQESVSGNQMQLELFGRERYLEKMQLPGHWFFTSVKDLLKYIISYYNQKRGTSQPELLYTDGTTDYLNFPDYSLGTFDFGDGLDLLTAIKRLVAWLNLPVPAFGAGTLHSIIFEDHPTDNTKIYIKIFEQGSITSNPDTLDSIGREIKLSRTNEIYDSNIKVIRGQEASATMPPNIAEWTSKIEEYDNFPLWKNTISYSAGVHVTWQGAVYKCIIGTIPGTTPASAFNWSVVTKSEYVGVSFVYSPYTKQKASVIQNFTMNRGFPLDVNFGSPAFVDSNLIIRDVSTWQDECIMRIRRLEDIPSQFLYYSSDGNTPVFDKTYEGIKFLIDSTLGTLETPFTGLDKYGKSFKDTVTQRDRDGDWIVIKTPERNDQVAIRSESKVYEYQKTFAAHAFTNSRKAGSFTPDQLAWRDASETPRSNHCFHYPTSIQNVNGLVKPLPGGTQHSQSAIKITYEFNSLDTWVTLFRDIFNGVDLPSIVDSAIKNLLWSKDFYNLGWWATLFEVPNPPATYYSISEKVGTLFGGDINSKVPTLDANNLNYTPTGKTGYDEADSNYLGKLYGIKFRFNFDITIGGGRRFAKGDIPFRCTIYDIEGNVWIYDFTYRILGDSQDIPLLFSGFKIYRARAPIALIPTLENITTPELLSLEVFERRKIKRITLQMQEVYDNDGRFDPTGYFEWWENFYTGVGATTAHTGIIDAFSFIKSPIAIQKGTESATHHLMSPISEYPSVSNVEQLKKIAQADLDLSLHPNDVFSITEPLKSIDKKPGESFYIKNKYLVDTSEKPDSGNTTIPNTREVVVISVNYTDNKDEGSRKQMETIKRI